MKKEDPIPRVSLADDTIAPLAGQFRALEWFGDINKRITPPKRMTLVAIVDDTKSWLECLASVLLYWPHVEIVTILQADDTQPCFPKETDIVLLDHYMGDITGNEIHRHLAFNHPNTLVGSISTSLLGKQYTRFHFPHKGEVLAKREAAEAFVDFMNALLSRIR